VYSASTLIFDTTYDKKNISTKQAKAHDNSWVFGENWFKIWC